MKSLFRAQFNRSARLGHDGEMTAPRWEPVDHFAGGAAESDGITVVESLADGEARRWECGSKGRAIGIPLRRIPSRWLSSVVFPDSAEVVFIEGAGVADLSSMLTEGGYRGTQWIALPKGTDASGLIDEGAQIEVATDRGTLVYRLLRVPDGHTTQRARLAAAPRVGESADVADKRAQWFGTRGGIGS